MDVWVNANILSTQLCSVVHVTHLIHQFVHVCVSIDINSVMHLHRPVVPSV